jgi:hypothetical protein
MDRILAEAEAIDADGGIVHSRATSATQGIRHANHAITGTPDMLTEWRFNLGIALFASHQSRGERRGGDRDSRSARHEFAAVGPRSSP